MSNLLNGLGGDAGFGENFLNRNDDSYTGYIDVSSVFTEGLNFFGVSYTGFYINNNGNITFNGGRGSFTPTSIVSETSNPEISVYFADVDTRGGTTTTTPGGTSTGSNLLWYDLDPGNGTVTITWDDVGYFAANNSKLNAFQIVLTDASALAGRSAGDFTIQFRYEDINWTTGDASGGTGGLGGTVARAGWSAGQGDASSFFEIPFSGVEQQMLAIDTLNGNTGLPGLWQWEVTNGAVPTSLAIEAVQGIVNEGNSGTTEVQFRVVRSGDTTTDISFNGYFSGTSATAIDSDDLDGMTLPHSEAYTMLAGETSMILILPVHGDTAMESNEAAVATISLPVAANGVPVIITQSQANVIIRNDDGLPPVIPPGWVIGRTSGDPHLVTLDGLAYDFQAVGEFVLSEAIAGSPFTVQVRTQAAPGSTVVSLTTAIATMLDGHRVSYDGLADTLRVDGVVVTVDPTVGNLAVGGGAIYRTMDGGYQVVYSGGDQALVFDDRGGYLDVGLALSPGRAGQLQGLLGDFDGSTGNDMALRDGRVLAQPLAFTDLYGSFASSWRITDGESLFTYATGENTAFFTSVQYPYHVMTLGDFPPALVAAARAQAATAGITDPTAQDAAVLDYLLTGDPTYFESAVGSPTPSTTLPVTGTPPAAPSVGLGIANAVADERDAGSTPFIFTLYRTDGSGALDVDWAVGSTAAEGADFVGGTLPSGVASFADGQTTTTITVAVQGDALAEQDETFVVTISTAAAGVTVVAPRATATIRNDDGPLPSSIAITAIDGALAEGQAGTTGFRFQLVRSGDTSGTASVDVTTGAAAGVSADAADLAGGFTTQTVTFNPGETHRTVSFDARGDTIHEAAETFAVSLDNASGATTGSAVAFATILNDDPLPVISIGAGPSQAEGNAGSTAFAFLLTRSGDLSAASSVAVTSSGGTAGTSDLVGGFGTQTVTFGAGEASKTFAVQVQGDTIVEPDEVFHLTLNSSANASLGVASATATIRNDDTAAPPPPAPPPVGGGFQRLTDTAEEVSYVASSGGVTVQALGGADRVTGSRWADAINGGTGNDAIDGGAGNDVITGGAGADRVKGGTGNDTFIFDRGDLLIAAANAGLMDHIIDFHGAGGYKAHLGVEDDMISFSGFSAGQLIFSHNLGGSLNQQVYAVMDGGVLQGNLLIQMADGTAHLAAGDYRWM